MEQENLCIVVHKLSQAKQILQKTLQPNIPKFIFHNYKPFYTPFYSQNTQPLGQSPQKPNISIPFKNLQSLNQQQLVYWKKTPYYSFNFIFQTQDTILHKQKALVKGNIEFNSEFEQGNLSKVIQRNNIFYLILENDLSTDGYTQWFFFKVKNKSFKRKLKFIIINLRKNYSHYNQGMKILYYTKQHSWRRGGNNISYYQNQLKRLQKKNNYYSLYWQFQFNQQEQIYFAHSYPYTYTQLIKDLQYIQSNIYFNNIFKRNLLTKTIANNNVQLITIGSNYKKKKKIIIISARVHPGESFSSFFMKGILNFLTSNNQIAIELRQGFVFKIIPMLNPDGVIHGNNRCSLSGSDLNRVWKKPSMNLHPQIYSFKKLIKKYQGSIKLFIDIHSHSKKKNIFFYGNSMQDDPCISRQFPYFMSRENQDFSYRHSSFKIQKNKQGTARINLFEQLKIPNIFTLQISNCGSSQKNYHFTTFDLQRHGEELCKGIFQFFCDKSRKVLQIHKEMLKNPSLINQIEQVIESESQNQDNDFVKKKLLKKFINKSKLNHKLKYSVNFYKNRSKIIQQKSESLITNKKQNIRKKFTSCKLNLQKQVQKSKSKSKQINNQNLILHNNLKQKVLSKQIIEQKRKNLNLQNYYQKRKSQFSQNKKKNCIQNNQQKQRELSKYLIQQSKCNQIENSYSIQKEIFNYIINYKKKKNILPILQNEKITQYEAQRYFLKKKF